jgi:UrcA family protein
MSPVLAQETEEIVVEAIRAVTVDQTSSGVPIKEVTLKQRVSYADLDLTTNVGVNKLEERIRETAKSSCRELDQKYPYTVAGPGKDCLQGAIDSGMVEARKAIDAAKSRAAESKTN